MGRKKREVGSVEPKAAVDELDRVPEADVEVLEKEIEGLATTGADDGAFVTEEEKGDRPAERYAAEVTDPENPLYHEHVLAWYVKMQIEASPLTPTEIAERSGVSASQIYRFLKGERSLTLESADKLLPVVGRSLVESLRRREEEQRSAPDSVEDQIEDEKERLRRRLEKWEKDSFAGVKEILVGVGALADKMRAMIDGL